jgi:hypothetical protein
MSAGEVEDDDLPRAMGAQIQAELAVGERLVWAGRAQPHPSLGRRVLPFSLGCFLPAAVLFLLGLVLFMAPPLVTGQGLFGQSGPTVFGAFAVFVGVVLLGAGGMLTAGAVVEDARTRRTCYALTNRRAIVWRPAQGTKGLEVRSFWPADLNTVYRIDRGDGEGDVVLHEVTIVVGANPQAIRQGFLGVRHVRHVEGLLRQTLLQPPAGPASQGVFAH